VNDPLIARFAAACGATGPLDLRVGLAEGGVLAEGSVGQPFTLIGRDDSCDVTLSDPDVHLRHAWLQVIDGRVFALDLGGRTGLVWPTGATGSGWLDAGVPVRVGPFRVQLRGPADARPPAPSPLQTDPTAAKTRAVVQLDFRNGKRVKDRWAVNRVVTLVGRSEACKIHLQAEDISSYHCGLVNTPAGLWVVDLSGRGVVVNGERMRVAPLPHGAELWVGRFLISCRYPALSDTPAAGTPAAAGGKSSPSLAGPVPAAGTPTRVVPVFPFVGAEDEVQLGGCPHGDPHGGLPSSHIMCDAFRSPASSGPISAPILVSGGHPTPPVIAVSSAARVGSGRTSADPGGRSSGRLRPPAPAPVEAKDDSQIGALLRQLGDIHGQMFEQVQQSLLMMVQLCGQVGPGRATAVQAELARIKELNGELAKLQGEVTRLALAQALAGTRVGATDPTAVTDLAPAAGGRRGADAAAAIEDWVRERIGSLQTERQDRWQKLAGMLGGRGG